MSSLIDMIQDMRTNEKKVENALKTTWSVYEHYMSELEHIIRDSVGMSRDNTGEMTKLHGNPEGIFMTHFAGMLLEIGSFDIVNENLARNN